MSNNDIEEIKNFVFEQGNKYANEIVGEKYQNKHFVFSIEQIKNGYAKKTITEAGYADWAAVYAFFDGNKKVHYVGKAYKEAWDRPSASVKEALSKSDDWSVLFIYGKLWIYTHELAEARIHDKWPESKHW